ncbi:MAG: protein kinase [Deltaproteobacteria bacterium]|nr:protein kinase [Deltaproteobacteria bacterium]
MRAPARIGKYELLEEIGHGGMATVHRAVLHGMQGFSRPVVIKRILPELAKDEHFVRMFVDEARVSALLQHPNIVQIYDFGGTDEYFIAMEHIDGVPLLRFMRHYGRRNPVPVEAAAYVMLQVCLGLHYAHVLQRDGRPLGLVHRDVSPGNVMLSFQGAVKVVDFGIAKAAEAIDREETRTGTMKGKWSYMSPEQAEGKDVTARSDVFSAGVVLWELLAGRRLFKGKTDYLTLTNVVQARSPLISSVRPDLPEELDRICACALSKRPADRFASAQSMAEALEGLLAGRVFGPAQLGALVREAGSGRRSLASVGVGEFEDDSFSEELEGSLRPGSVTQTGSSLRRRARPRRAVRGAPRWMLMVALGCLLGAGAIVAVLLLLPGPPGAGQARRAEPRGTGSAAVSPPEAAARPQRTQAVAATPKRAPGLVHRPPSRPEPKPAAPPAPESSESEAPARPETSKGPRAAEAPARKAGPVPSERPTKRRRDPVAARPPRAGRPTPRPVRKEGAPATPDLKAGGLTDPYEE